MRVRFTLSNIIQTPGNKFGACGARGTLACLPTVPRCLERCSQGVKPHGDKFEDLPDHAKSPSETVGIWHLQLDSEGKKVKDIFFLRQLSPDELHRKVRERRV